MGQQKTHDARRLEIARCVDTSRTVTKSGRAIRAVFHTERPGSFTGSKTAEAVLKLFCVRELVKKRTTVALLVTRYVRTANESTLMHVLF